jgi:GNAT superfamily N-acetyltransferase
MLHRPYNDVEKLNQLFALAFPKSTAEILSAVQGGKYAGDELNRKGYDFTNSFVPVLRCARTGAIVASAIVVEKKIVKKNTKGVAKSSLVHEIVWFATFSELRGKGYGSRLFSELHALAARAQSAAILIESCDTALSYWLGLCDVPIARCLIREKPRMVQENQTAEDKAATLWREPDEACVRRAERLNQLLQPQEKGGVFEQVRFPPVALEQLYTEGIFRDKKGKAKDSSSFQGAPYRYGTPEATHIWFPISSGIRGGLGKAEIVVRKKPSLRTLPQIDTAHESEAIPVPPTPCTPFAAFSLSTPKVDATDDGFKPEPQPAVAPEPDEAGAEDVFGMAKVSNPKRKLSKQERQALERRRRAKLLAGEQLSSDEEDDDVVVRQPSHGSKRLLAGKRRTVTDL